MKLLRSRMLWGYALLVGVPLLVLVGILEAGRSLVAPMGVGGEWVLTFDAPDACPSGVARIHQPAFSISQSGTEATITLNEGHATPLPAHIDGTTLSAAPLRATISGKPGQHTLAGTLQLDGCAPLEFHAVRQAPAKKAGE